MIVLLSLTALSIFNTSLVDRFRLYASIVSHETNASTISKYCSPGRHLVILYTRQHKLSVPLCQRICLLSVLRERKTLPPSIVVDHLNLVRSYARVFCRHTFCSKNDRNKMTTVEKKTSPEEPSPKVHLTTHCCFDRDFR